MSRKQNHVGTIYKLAGKFLVFLDLKNSQLEAILESAHRRRITTEEKAKVVAAVWGTELIRFLAMLAILH